MASHLRRAGDPVVFLNVKLEGQARFAVHRRGNQNISDLIGEAYGHRFSIVKQARVEVNLREAHDVRQDAT
jgi:hypothetical protein